VRARGIEQRRGRAAHPPGAERNAPDTVDGDGQRAAKRPAVAIAPVRVDLAAAEIRHEEIAAETAEPARRKGDAPRLVELVGAADVRQQPAVEVELVDVAAARRVVAVHRCTERVRDEDPVPDRLDAERCEPLRLRAIHERAWPYDTAPARVEDDDAVVVEVRRVQLPARERDPAEHRA
jgi:hypothetical protein